MPPDSRTFISSQKHPVLKTCQVGTQLAPVYRNGSRRSPVETQLLFGTKFRVHRLKRGWAWGQEVSPSRSQFPGYVGWIPSKMFADTSSRVTHRVTCLRAPVFTAPDIKSPIVNTLFLNSQVAGTADGVFVQTGVGFIHARHLQPVTDSYTETDFVVVAEAHLGLPYIWGGISSDGLDCSGLVQTSLRAIGRDAPRDSDMQAKIGRAVSQSELTRGDLVFWKGHVGIMQNKTRMIHANGWHMKTASEPLADAIQRIGQSTGPVTAMRRLEKAL